MLDKENTKLESVQEQNDEPEEVNTETEETGLEAKVVELEAQVVDYLDSWKRARAELANFKRRTEAQRADMVSNANANLLTRMLPILDDLELAIANMPSEEHGTDGWSEWSNGLDLISRKFHGVLESAGVTVIEADEKEFDPAIHEAISFEPSEEHESGEIIEQIRAGYCLGERVLRASQVRVAR
ncbi:MAG: nucleotide exchange factor GrpE [Chloroflexota bacterium]